MAYGDSGGVEVEGLNQLRRTLRQAGDDLSDFRAVNTEAAGVAASAGRRRVPVRSGRLERTVRSSGTKTAGIIRAGTAAVPYAGPIHWGWFARNIKPNTFLTDGAQESQPLWVPIYEAYLNKAIEKVHGI